MNQTDWRKYRKSSHLASADLDAMESDGIPLLFTIKEVKYESQTMVSGTKMDGIFCYFQEPLKPLKLNSTNCNILASFTGIAGKEKHIIENWVGLKIELFVDHNVKFKGTIVDGIRINPVKYKEKTKPTFTEAKFEAAKKSGATLEQIKSHYLITPEIEQLWNNYNQPISE
jgi:hypothetical protein